MLHFKSLRFNKQKLNPYFMQSALLIPTGELVEDGDQWVRQLPLPLWRERQLAGSVPVLGSGEGFLEERAFQQSCEGQV